MVFPRAEKKDKRYNPDLILIVYWMMTTATALRFISQAALSFYFVRWLNVIVTIASTLQVIAMTLFFIRCGKNKTLSAASIEKPKEKNFNDDYNRRLYKLFGVRC